MIASEDPHKQTGHKEADQSASGEGQHPGQHHFLDHREIDGRQTLDRTDAHDGGRFGVRGGNGQAEQ